MAISKEEKLNQTVQRAVDSLERVREGIISLDKSFSKKALDQETERWRLIIEAEMRGDPTH